MAIFTSTAAAPAAYATDPTFVIPFTPKRMHLYSESVGASHVLYISFDGVTDHIRLSHVSPTYDCEQGVTRIWTRLGTDTPSCTVIAES